VAWLGDRYRRGLLLIALALAPLTTLRLYAADEIEYFAYLRSAVFDQDLDFTNEYGWFVAKDPVEYDAFARTFLIPKTPAGRAPNNAPIGSAILWAPFYVPTVIAESLLGTAADPPGYSRWDVTAICLASMLYGVFGLLLANEACRRFASDRAAFVASVLVWLGSNLLFYMYVTPPMSHAVSFFASALLLWAWLGAEPGPRTALAIGMLGGLLASVRWQDGLFLLSPLAAPVLAGAVRDAAAVRRWVVSSAALAVGFMIAFAPQLLVWWRLNGSLTPFGVISLKGRLSLTAPYLFGVLFSPFHGLLVWTPILLPAFVGLAVLAVRDGRGRAIALGVLAQLYLLSGYVVAFGHGFGQRLFVSSLPAAAIGLAVFVDRFGRKAPRAALAAFVLAIWWNLSLIVQHATGLIPRDQGVSLGTLVWNQLVEVPRKIPDVALRYVFHRRSLYKNDPGAEGSK
jgi:hypothetical protein